MATGDFVSCTINGTAGKMNGAYASIVVEGDVTGSFAFVQGSEAAPNVEFRVTKSGYDSAGVASSPVVQVIGTTVVRQVYPNEANDEVSYSAPNTTILVALDRSIHSGDTVEIKLLDGWFTSGAGDGNNTGGFTSTGVTNSSSLAYPKVVGEWVTQGYDIVGNTSWPSLVEEDATTFTVEMIGFHESGKDGKPLACVKVTCADQSANSVTVTVSATTKKQDPNTSLWYSVYRATFSFSSFTSGDKLDINFEAYPHHGVAASVLKSVVTGGDGTAQPHPELGPLHLFYWPSHTVIHAYVDADAGNDGTGVASQTQGTAQASPYLTVRAALLDAKAENNTVNTLNTVAGVIVHLEEATAKYALSTTSWTALSNENTPVGIIKGADGTVLANVVVDGDGSAVGWYGNLRYQHITVQSTTSTGVFRGSDTTPSFYVFEGVHFESKTQNIPNIWDVTAFSMINCDITDFSCVWSNSTGQPHPTKAILGCAGIGSSYAGTNTQPDARVYLANKQILFKQTVLSNYNYDASFRAISLVYAWNENLNLGDSADDSPQFAQDAAPSPGIAIVGNVFERAGGTNPGSSVCTLGPNGDYALEHFVMAHNTFAGMRQNMFYNNDVSAIRDNCRVVANSFGISINCKGDVFELDGTMVGNFTIKHGVGFAHNRWVTVTAGVWKYKGIGSFQDAVVGTDVYNTDASIEGTNAGNGNYEPAAGGLLVGLIEPKNQIVGHDLYGSDFASLADIGAVQLSAPASGGLSPAYFNSFIGGL